MAEKMDIDMSLDDLIKKNSSKFLRRGRGGRGRGRGGGTRGFRSSGGIQTGNKPRFNFTSPRGTFKAKTRPLFLTTRKMQQNVGGPPSGPSKLLISNLDYGVSDSDIKELFGDFGNIRKAVVHYDQSGRSLGTADVVFDNRANAIRALKKYNGVPLDGETRRKYFCRPMKIQITSSYVPYQSNFSETFNRRGGTSNRFTGRGRGFSRGRGRGGFNRI